MKSINDITFPASQILLRVDFNVPLNNGEISDDTRIRASLPTIKHLSKYDISKIVIISHFGRPDGYDPNFTLQPVAEHLANLLGEQVEFIDGIIDNITPGRVQASNSRIVMLDNLRFSGGEYDNSSEFAEILADCVGRYNAIFINDAFSCSHRAHASVAMITKYLPAFAGLNLAGEIASLELATGGVIAPVMAIIGGAKISTKLKVISNLITKLDYLAIGGAMVNNFLLAQGYEIGKSLVEPELFETTLALIQQAQQCNCKLILPNEVVVAEEISAARGRIVGCANISVNDSVFDLSAANIDHIIDTAKNCKMVLWNGPVGAFEFAPFAAGSVKLARELSRLNQAGIKVIAGGGDTISAINTAKAESFYYISNAGGAFLEWLEGKELPGITALYK